MPIRSFLEMHVLEGEMFSGNEEYASIALDDKE